MNPVVGLDVSKGESRVQAFLDKGKPYRKSFKVSHTVEGLGVLVKFLEDVKKETGQKPPIILESTGHYHSPVVHYLEYEGVHGNKFKLSDILIQKRIRGFLLGFSYLISATADSPEPKSNALTLAYLMSLSI
jgi:hypothetical protein